MKSKNKKANRKNTINDKLNKTSDFKVYELILFGFLIIKKG